MNEVKELAEKFENLSVAVVCTQKGNVFEVVGILHKESRKALASVALEFCEERRKKDAEKIANLMRWLKETDPFMKYFSKEPK